MTRKRKNRRVRGSDGKLYDPRKQADNGHRAHESRVGTAARRARWRSRGMVGTLTSGLLRTGSILLGITVWVFLNVLVRPTRRVLGLLWAGVRMVGGLLGSLLGRGRRTGRTTGSRVRKGRK